MTVEMLQSGDIFEDRYRIIDPIGKSGNSRIYHAHDQRIGRDVTLKIFALDDSWDESEKQLFIKEITIAGKLNHPNISLLYNTDIKDNLCFITSEYNNGYSLRTILNLKPVIRPEVSWEIIYYVCKALLHAHENEIIHRHVQPASILLTNNNSIKLSDFSVRSYIHYQTSSSLENAVDPSIFAYHAPEILQGEQPGISSDLYSLGITFYEMLCGRRPFNAATYESFTKDIERFSFPRPQKLNPNISGKLEDIILRLIARDKDDRFTSVTELITQLEGMYDEGNIDAFISEYKKIEQEAKILSRADTIEISEEERVVYVQRDDDDETVTQVDFYDDEPDDITMEAKPRKNIPPWAVIGIGVLLIIICATVFYTLYKRGAVDKKLKEADRLFEQGIYVTLDHSGAYSIYQEVLDINEGNSQARTKTAAIRKELWSKYEQQQQTSDWENAFTTFQLIKIADPGNPDLKKNDEYINRKIDEYRKAEKKRIQALELVNQAAENLKNGDLDEAIVLLGQAQEISPNLPETLLVEADLLLKQDKTDEAIATFNDIKLRYPNFIEARMELGETYRKLGDYQKAEEEFRKAVELAPSRKFVHYYLANILGLQQKNDEAIKEYKKELEVNEHPLAHFNLGYLLHRQKQYDDAIIHYSRTIELQSDLLQAYYNLGTILFKQEKYQEAREILGKALIHDPDYFKAQKLLEQINTISPPGNIETPPAE